MASFQGVKLKDGTISYRDGLRRETFPVAGAEAWVESAGAIDRRLSLARTGGGALLLGPFGAVLGAIAKKKVDDRQLFLLINGPGFAWSVEVPVDKVGMDGSRKGYAKRQQKRARKFAAEVTAAGSRRPLDYPPPIPAQRQP